MAAGANVLSDAAPAESTPETADAAVRPVDLVVWALALIPAIVVRVALSHSGWGALNADEAVVGLMGHNLLDGETATFYWGQDYGGSIESVLAALAFVPFGTSVLALRLSTLALDAVAALLVFLLGRRLVGTRAAGYATAMFVIGPVGIAGLSISSRGFYWSTLICGLVLALFALRAVERPEGRLDWFVSGVAGGVGFWQSPQILYFAIPVIVFVAVRLGRHVLRAWPSLAGAVLGAGVWLFVNVRDGFPSLDRPPQAVDSNYVDRLRVFADEGVPVALGFQFDGRWFMSIAPLLLIVLMVAVAYAFWRRPPASWLLFALLAASPFVFALFPFSWTVGEGRYMVFTWPFIALAIAHAARWRALQIVCVAVVAALTLHWADDFGAASPISPNVAVPKSTAELRDYLEEEGITRAFADYWIAYRLTFETGEDVIVATTGPGRYQRYDDEVRASPNPVWIFVNGSIYAPRFEAELNRLGVPFETTEVGGFVIYETAEKVIPEQIAPETWLLV